MSLASAVRELCLAWQKLSLYQAGHPLRGKAVESAHGELTRHLARQGAQTLGVTRDGLVGADETLDSPLARRLAAALHRQGIALVRFNQGLEPAELTTFLSLLHPQPGADDDRPLWSGLAAGGVRHVDIEGIDFTELVDDDADPLPQRVSLWERVLAGLLRTGLWQQDPGTRTDREATLEELLAAVRALIGRRQLAAGAGSEAEADRVLERLVEELRQAIDGHLAAAAQAAADGTGDGPPAGAQVAELLGALPARLRPPVLDGALGRLCATGAARDGLAEIAAAVPPAELLAGLRRLRAEGLTPAPEAMLELDAVLVRAVGGSTADPAALAERLAELYGDGDTDRVLPAPGDGERPVLRLPRPPAAVPPPPELGPRLETLDPDRRRVRLAQTLFGLLQRGLFEAEQRRVLAERLTEVFGDLLAAGRVATALRIARATGQLAAARRQTGGDEPEPRLARFRDAVTVAAVTDALGAGGEAAQAPLLELIELLGPQMVRRLLLALGEEEDRSRRRRLFDLLVELGPAAAPHAAALLEDPRWFVVRNMLSLLQRVRGGVTPAVIERGLAHEDARVRLETVRCLAVLGAAAPAALIERAVGDADPKVAESAVALPGVAASEAGRRLLLALLAKGNPQGSPEGVRLRALEALAQHGDPAVLPELDHFLRAWLGGVTAGERRAAFAALAHYPPEARAPYLARGLRSPDREVRAICVRLRGEAEG